MRRLPLKPASRLPALSNPAATRSLKKWKNFSRERLPNGPRSPWAPPAAAPPPAPNPSSKRESPVAAAPPLPRRCCLPVRASPAPATPEKTHRRPSVPVPRSPRWFSSVPAAALPAARASAFRSIRCRSSRIFVAARAGTHPPSLRFPHVTNEPLATAAPPPCARRVSAPPVPRHRESPPPPHPDVSARLNHPFGTAPSLHADPLLNR